MENGKADCIQGGAVRASAATAAVGLPCGAEKGLNSEHRKEVFFKIMINIECLSFVNTMSLWERVSFLSFIFQLQFTFSIILYLLQVYSTVVQQLYTLKVEPWYFRYLIGTIHSYYNIVDYTPYAVLSIPVTTL